MESIALTFNEVDKEKSEKAIQILKAIYSHRLSYGFHKEWFELLYKPLEIKLESQNLTLTKGISFGSDHVTFRFSLPGSTSITFGLGALKSCADCTLSAFNIFTYSSSVIDKKKACKIALEELIPTIVEEFKFSSIYTTKPTFKGTHFSTYNAFLESEKWKITNKFINKRYSDRGREITVFTYNLYE